MRTIQFFPWMLIYEKDREFFKNKQIVQETVRTVILNVRKLAREFRAS